MNVADSTVALSLYNAVAGEGASTLEDAHSVLARHGYLLPMSSLEAALRHLVGRGLMTEDADRRLEPTGPRGLVVVERDRSDPEGWTGWRVAPHAPQQNTLLVGRAP